MTFGAYIRTQRETLGISLRQIAVRVGTDPGYLSRVEMDNAPKPTERLVRQLAIELGEDCDVLLAIAGRISESFQAALQRHPQAFATLIRGLQGASQEVLEQTIEQVRKVSDGEW